MHAFVSMVKDLCLNTVVGLGERLVWMRPISYRSIIELGAFWNFHIFGRISICQFHIKHFDRTGKKCWELIFPVLLIWETDPKVEKSSKSLTETIYRSSGLENSLLSYSALKLILKKVQRCWLSSFEVSLGLNISETIDPINVVPKSFLISFMSSFHDLFLFVECKQIIFLIFFLQWNTCVWSSHTGIKTQGQNFQNAPNSIFDPNDKSFICTKFQAFTTFSAILTCIRDTIITFVDKIILLNTSLDCSLIQIQT